MIEYYPSLVEAAIEFKIYSRKIIAKFKGKFSVCSLIFLGENFEMLPEFETIDHSDQFRLEKCPQTDYIYCLKPGQTIAQRIAEKRL